MTHEETVRSHAVWALLEESAAIMADVEVPDSLAVQFARVRTLVAATLDVRDNVPAEFIASQELAQMNSHATQVRNQLNSFKGQTQPQHKLNQLNAAEQSMDQLVSVAGWMLPYAQNATGPAASTLAAAQTVIGEAHGRTVVFEKRVAKLEAQLNATVTAEEKRATDAATKAATQLSATTAAAAALTARLEADEARLGAEIERQANTFNETQARWASAFDDAQSRQGDAFDDAQTSRATSLEAEIAEMKKTAVDDLAAVGEAKTQAQEHAGMIAVSSLASGHKEDADDHTLAMNIFRGGVVVTFGVAVVIAVWALNAAEVTVDDVTEFKFDRFAARFAISLLLSGLATYLGSQAGVHRKGAEHSRQLQRQLQAFGPYVAPLSEPQQREVRLLMAPHFFPNVTPTADGDGESTADKASMTAFAYTAAKNTLDNGTE